MDIWRSAARFDATRGSDKVFVATIARRRLIDRMRKKSGEPPMEPAEALESIAWSDPASLPDTAIDAAHAARALGELRPEQRQVLELGPDARLQSIGDRIAALHAAGNREIAHAARADACARTI